MGEKGEGSGGEGGGKWGKGGGNWEWGTPLSTPSILDNLEIFNNIDVVIAINDVYTITRDFHYCTLRTCPSGHIIPLWM